MLLRSILTFLIIGTIAAEYLELENVDPTELDLKNIEAILLSNITIKTLPKNLFQGTGSDPIKIRIKNSQLETIDKEAFDGLEHLNALDLINDEITDLDPETFSRLKVLEILNLDGNKLNSVRLNVPLVQELVLSNNLMEGLGENFLTGEKLRILDLSGNKISYLNFSFGPFEILERVDLSRNQIQNLNGYVFGNNTRLAFLNISKNLLCDTEGLKLESLVDLDLSCNAFTVLNSEMFSGMINLEYLVLSGNGIADMKDPFKYLNNLKELDLSFNAIEKVDADLFKSNFRLEKLNLNGNSIKALNSLSTELKSLNYFYASNNLIETVDGNFFQKMTRLLILDLSYNQLADINGLFEPLKTLNKLNLAVNNISALSPFTSLDLRFLNLSSNALDLNFDFFKKSPEISRVDLSNNKITDFCVDDINFGQLIDIDLSDNYITDVKCFINGKLEKLDAVDIRGNPLVCDNDLDDTVHYFATKLISPSVFVDNGDDVMNVRNTPNETLTIWNKVKKELCPEGLDIIVVKPEDLKESLEDEDSEASDYGSNENASQVGEDKVKVVEEDQGEKSEKDGEQAERLPLDQLSSTPLAAQKLELNVQSQKSSWEPILEDTYVNDVAIIDEDEIKKAGYTWYTVALVLIGISLSLVCVNVAGFMYLRSRSLSRRDAKFDQTYTQLNNDVYRDTTEPVGAHPPNNLYANNGTNNKIFLYDQVQELLLNFGFYKKGEEDSESIKKMIVNTTSNSALQQC